MNNKLIMSLFFSTACIFRYNALSLVYLLFLLLLPWFQWPNKHTLRGKRVSHAFIFNVAILCLTRKTTKCKTKWPLNAWFCVISSGVFDSQRKKKKKIRFIVQEFWLDRVAWIIWSWKNLLISYWDGDDLGKSIYTVCVFEFCNDTIK